jgi:hypothetical protein
MYFHVKQDLYSTYVFLCNVDPDETDNFQILEECELDIPDFESDELLDFFKRVNERIEK